MTDVTTSNAETPGAGPLARNPAYADSPGAAYVLAYLPALGSMTDGATLAELIDAGTLTACPRCHFLHLPAPAFPFEAVIAATAPVDACDVCAHVPYVARLSDFHHDSPGRTYDDARAALAGCRRRRAETLFDLWMDASRAAEAWVLAALGDALADVRALSREVSPRQSGPGRTDSEGEA